MLLIGRQDYFVRSLSFPEGLETWNATFSKLRHLNPLSSGSAAGGGGALQRFLRGDDDGGLEEPTDGLGALPLLLFPFPGNFLLAE